MKYEENVCSICFKEFKGFGNNAMPVNEGRCCDECNRTVVLTARINRVRSMSKARVVMRKMKK